MKEVEIEDAVGLAQDYTGRWIMMPADAVEQVCKALIALDKDEVEEDDDSEPLLTEPTEGRLDYALNQLVKHNGLGGNYTLEESETQLYDEDLAKLETLAADIDSKGCQPDHVQAWPPWTYATSERDRLTLHDIDTQNYHLGMRVNLDNAPMDRWSCFKRWLFKRNWRVVKIVSMCGGSVTVERSR